MGDVVPLFLSSTPVLGVDDVEVALAWWRDTAGFDERVVNRAADPDADPTNYAVLVRDAVAVHLVRRAEAEPGLGRSEVMIAVSGVDALAPAFGGAPADHRWGRSFVVHDPDGNRVEFYEPPQ